MSRSNLLNILLILSFISSTQCAMKQELQSNTYTLATWTVKSGMESEFIKAWDDFAKWTAANVEGGGTGRLLQDDKNPFLFYSFGPWENKDAVAAWRETESFKNFFAKAKELCTEIQPHSLTVVATSK